MSALPRHIAIIPDGNSRWAKAHGQPARVGYQAGFQALEEVISRTQELGVGYMTVYLVSAENLARRSPGWRTDFYSFASKALYSSLEDEILMKVRVRLVGDLSLIPSSLRQDLESLVLRTRDNTGLLLSLAIGYTGREEILRAVEGLLQDRRLQAQAKGEAVLTAPVTEEEFERYLAFPSIPSPDLLIRTSGEVRLSGFLLWHLAYTEMTFVDELWPDFTVDRFDEVLTNYQHRQRNFGAERESHAA